MEESKFTRAAYITMILCLIAILLFVLNMKIAHAQEEKPTHYGIFGTKIEYQSKYKAPGGIFFGGYRFNNHYIGLETHLAIGNNRSTPQGISGIYGYNIGSFQPYISYGFYTCGGEAIKEGEGTQGFNGGFGLSYFPQSIGFRFSIGLDGLESISNLKNYKHYGIFSIGYYRAL